MQWTRSAVFFEEHRNDLDIRFKFAQSCRRLGVERVEAGARGDARRLFEKARQLVEPLAELNPNVDEYQFELEELKTNIADLDETDQRETGLESEAAA